MTDLLIDGVSVIMSGDKAQEYFDYLDEKYSDWYSNPRQRLAIENEIREVASQWDDDIYLYINDGRATGLFEHGFFESDIQTAFYRLKDIIKQDVINAIMQRLNTITVPQNPLLIKEFKDFLIANFDPQSKAIHFQDDADKEYFERLAQELGYDAEDLLMSLF